MTTNWVISAMDCKVLEGDMSDVVITVHWRFQGNETSNGKNYFAESYGATTLGLPDPETFTPFESLTQAQVVGWLEQELDVVKMTASLQNDINLQINPTNVTLTPPWSNSPSFPTPNIPG